MVCLRRDSTWEWSKEQKKKKVEMKIGRGKTSELGVVFCCDSSHLPVWVPSGIDCFLQCLHILAQRPFHSESTQITSPTSWRIKFSFHCATKFWVSCAVCYTAILHLQLFFHVTFVLGKIPCILCEPNTHTIKTFHFFHHMCKMLFERVLRISPFSRWNFLKAIIEMVEMPTMVLRDHSLLLLFPCGYWYSFTLTFFCLQHLYHSLQTPFLIISILSDPHSYPSVHVSL